MGTDHKLDISLPRSSRIAMPGLIGQLWGTTTLQDCLTVLKLGLNKRLLVQGSTIREYEQEFARRVGVRYAYSFASGRVALFALLRSFQIKEDDDVLLQVPTHIVVPNAVRYAGGKPVFVDCDLNTYNMDLDLAEKRITPRTRVLLIQHTFGIPVDVDRAREIARKHNLILIEDCVHALGATFNNRPIGSFGQGAFFSTEETKIISSTMGGMAVTDDPEIAARLKSIQETCAWPEQNIVWRYLLKLVVYYLFTHRFLHPFTRPIYMRLRQDPRTHLAPGATHHDEMHGIQPSDYMVRLSNGQAVIALRQLSRLEVNLQHRRNIAEAFRQELSERGFQTIKPPAGAQPSYVRYPIMVSDRPAAYKKALRRVILGQWFNSVLEESASPEYGGYVDGSCPNAELAAQQLVNVPTHFRIRQSDVRPIIDILSPYLWKVK